MSVLCDVINKVVKEKAGLCIMACQAVQSAVGSDDELCRGR